ncbi:hypothetical protein ID866_2015 [Astraeus odoratus]|nr:hypothetical protein ID866_2015 [Astraeus odoratus]
MANARPNPAPGSRQKRVLPSRSRRGGPGVGSCDVDLMILDAQRRRFDNEPLIPADTPFLLTTNSALLGSSPNPGTFPLNNVAKQRYFDRPEVIQAYREQQIIETPEFTLLPEDASVGGRFRPRSSAEDLADTSDAAYEKRHRKYETFEKRQRLREKEKLKHEQYKLKERIEQLRAMDGSAFLTLPTSSFSFPPEGNLDYNHTSVNANGAVAYSEGERRRQQMLEVASSLEERYRTLLPSDKKLADLRSASRQSSVNLNSSDVHSREESSNATTVPSNGSPIILKIKVPQPRQRDSGSHPPFASSPAVKSETLSHCSPSPTKPISQTSPSQRPRKRLREDSDSPRSSPEYQVNDSYSFGPKTETCMLVQWAERHQSAQNTRKTQRHVTAFGTKVPQEIEEVRDFEIPPWLRDRSPLSSHMS